MNSQKRTRRAGFKGKKLEGEFLRSLQRVKGAWAYRLTDKVFVIYTRRGLIPAKASSPADMILIGKHMNLLIECKEVRSGSIPFLRLEPHQLQELLDFRARGENRFRAYVVVQFFGVKDEPYLCVAIPIRKWLREELLGERKSLNWKRAVELGVRLNRIKGSMWDVRSLVEIAST